MSPSGVSEPSVNRVGVFGVALMKPKRCCSAPSTSASCSSTVSAPGPQTSMHSRQPVHFHGSTVAAKRPPVPGCSFSGESKNGRVRATG